MNRNPDAAAAARDTGPAPRMTGRALTVLLTATFIGQFDFFVVNVAAPSLRHDLHTSDALLQMVVGGYAFAYAAGLITGGRLGDLLGHRRMYVAGMAASPSARSRADSLAVQSSWWPPDWPRACPQRPCCHRCSR